jgi:hypothetical protein
MYPVALDVTQIIEDIARAARQRENTRRDQCLHQHLAPIAPLRDQISQAIQRPKEHERTLYPLLRSS